MNARGKIIDKTFLSLDQAEDRGFIHRDYIAHCLRWTHVIRRLLEKKRYVHARILDVGCGRELPFAKLLYSSKLIPRQYYGVDIGPIDPDQAMKVKGGKFPCALFQNTNFLELNEELHNVDVVVCFEVLEHVEPRMAIDMLEHMKKVTVDNAIFFISTPNWNRTDCAANHVNEMLYEALGAMLERHGFQIESVHGTFASIRDYEHLLPSEERKLFEKLRAYYDTNFLSCIFAPLYPAQSRNALWELTKAKQPQQRKFPFIEEIQKPWSSSVKWEDMAL